MNYLEFIIMASGILFSGIFIGIIASYIRLDYLGAVDIDKIKEAKKRSWKENFLLYEERLNQRERERKNSC